MTNTIYEEGIKRKPQREILKKVSIGVMCSLVLMILLSVLNGEPLSYELLSTSLFLMGGIFLLFGASRDFLNSVIIHKIRAKDLKGYLKSEKHQYLFGFGVEGEDVITGFLLVILAIFVIILI